MTSQPVSLQSHIKHVPGNVGGQLRGKVAFQVTQTSLALKLYYIGPFKRQALYLNALLDKCHAHMEQRMILQNLNVLTVQHDFANQLIKTIKMSTHMPYRTGSSKITYIC